MDTKAQAATTDFAVITSYGGENVVGFRVVRTNVWSGRSRRPGRRSAKRRTVGELNRWLLENAAAVDAYARASSARLIGREGL